MHTHNLESYWLQYIYSFYTKYYIVSFSHTTKFPLKAWFLMIVKFYFVDVVYKFLFYYLGSLNFSLL